MSLYFDLFEYGLKGGTGDRMRCVGNGRIVSGKSTVFSYKATNFLRLLRQR